MITTQQPQTIKNVPTVERINVTPDMALRWLETTNTNNRKVSEKHVHRLARDMTDGKWRLTHVGIAFDPNGTLLDGQHRLWAITMSGTTVDMYVWRNVSPEVMMAIDCGKTRSMADILNIAGKNGDVNNHHLAILRSMLGSFGNPPSLSPAETSQLLRTHHDAITFAIEHLPVVAFARGLCTATTRSVIARATYSVDHAMLRDFCRKLATGIVTSNHESVIVQLRQYLITSRGTSYCQRAQRYGKVERVLAAWLKGENPSRIYPASFEQYPLPEEVND